MPGSRVAYGADDGRIPTVIFHAMTATASFSRSPAYDITLLAHVLAALVGFGSVAMAGGYALLVGRGGPVSESVRRYYRPGVNWAGRIVFLVPVLGVALVAMSGGVWSFSDDWVMIGLVLWALAAVAGEAILWPAERRLQQIVTAERPDTERPDTEHRRSLCRRVAATSAVMLVVFVAAVVIMVSKP